MRGACTAYGESCYCQNTTHTRWNTRREYQYLVCEVLEFGGSLVAVEVFRHSFPRASFTQTFLCLLVCISRLLPCHLSAALQHLPLQAALRLQQPAQGPSSCLPSSSTSSGEWKHGRKWERRRVWNSSLRALRTAVAWGGPALGGAGALEQSYAKRLLPRRAGLHPRAACLRG